MADDRRVPGELRISRLRLRGRHGAYPGERERERDFLVDVSLAVDIAEAARTDDLASTADFAAVAQVLREIVGGPPRRLLETVALEAARAVLERFSQVNEVRLRLAKAEPPGLDADEESVEIGLRRS